MTLILPGEPAIDTQALDLAQMAMAATQTNLDAVVAEMIEQPQHVLLFEEGQEDEAHLALQQVAVAVVEQQAPTNPTLEGFVVLDSREDGWADVAPILEVTPLKEVKPGVLHHTQMIFAFGTAFMRSNVVKPVASRATRFYAAIPRTTLAEDLIERVHPIEEAVVL